VKADFKVDFRAARCVKLRETPQYAELFSRICTAGEDRQRRTHEAGDDAVWQIAIGLGALAIWQWGWDLHAVAPWLVPDLLDPISSPSPRIFRQFLRMSCLVSSQGQWTSARLTPSSVASANPRTISGSPLLTLKNTLWARHRVSSASSWVCCWTIGSPQRNLLSLHHRFNSIPRIALAPIIILAFGIGDASKIVRLGWCGVPGVLNTFEGARAVDRDHINAPACWAPANGR